MTLVTEKNDSSSTPPYYIPHHFVLKESSTTTKFRVVFDASAKTSSGISLNDRLMVGPTTQDSLISILMRFRKHAIAFTADIAKMYRQILVKPEDTDLQRIVWRSKPNQPIQEYRLLTTTYGTASAPYQATKVLQRLAEDEKTDLPLAHSVTQEDVYMDDFMSGASDVQKALNIQSQLLQLMARGGFELRKWSSNSAAVLEALPAELRETQLPLDIDLDESVKTLGLRWNPALDEFSFKVNLPPYIPSYTKRSLLSEVSKVFDPLGWLAPTVIRAKIMFQELWKTNVGWDDPLPANINEEWIEFRKNLPSIENIKISRCFMPTGSSNPQLYGFSDASERAYSACVYFRAILPSGQPFISLIAAKTRVAPSKPICIPRLELCGALLLAQLMETIQKSLKVQFESIRAWTDSTVVLDWIKSHPSRWKTFVGNRVTQIQNLIPYEQWSHVSGVDNPADCASRGIDPSELASHPLWWRGPRWLMDLDPRPHHTNIVDNQELTATEERPNTVVSHVCTNTFQTMFDVSSYTKLTRITAWSIRFTNNCRSATRKHNKSQPAQSSRRPLSTEELTNALLTLIKIVQGTEFSEDIRRLESGKQLAATSRLKTLNPFMDSMGVLRVGGRIRRSALPVDQKTPMLLPRHHKLTTLIIQHQHLTHLHAGPQLLLTTLLRRFWIIGAKSAVRQQIKKCIVCTRFSRQVTRQFMADLPAARVTPTRAFLVCGVDYAGPFIMRPITPRSKVTYKAYLALFVCFSTRALHLEIVSSLCTNSFLEAFRRFLARRGLCTDVYSDCGTNFVGADKELKELYKLVNSSSHGEKVAADCAGLGIRWHFNPPSAPHFGGLWEAGVNSVKHHLHRVVGNTRLTYEELSTVVCKIEACLNSRPLTPTSDDPNDLTALTPAHFIIGDSLTSIPEPDLTTTPVNRLTRWQLTQQLSQHFWKRWSAEYLSRLHQRPKWLQHRAEIKIHDLVLVKDERLPPLKWRLGRVTATHPGPDGLTRVVSVKTADGEFRRPIVKLCLLPMDKSAETEDKVLLHDTI